MNACSFTAVDRDVLEGNENGNFLSLFVSHVGSLYNVQLRPLFLPIPPCYRSKVGGLRAFRYRYLQIPI